MKRFFRILFLSALATLCLATFASAEVIEGQFGYMGGCETMYSLDTVSGVLRVYPDREHGFTHTRIGEFLMGHSPATKHAAQIKTVIIEEGIYEVGKFAFYD